MRPLVSLSTVVLGLSVFSPGLEAQGWQPYLHYLSGPKARFLPDQNNDGVVDLLVVDPNYYNIAGELRVVSGADLKSLFTLVAPRGLDIGSGAVELADVDGDRVADFLIGALNDNGGRGTLFAYSGRTRQLLFTLTGTVQNERLGTSVCLIDFHPLVRDGKPELVVSGRGEGNQAQGNTPGFVRVYDLGTTPPTQIWSVSKGGDRDYFGSSVANLGDVDADGYDDLGVGMVGHHLGSMGWIVMYSGFLKFETSTVGPQGLGSSLSAADIDGDNRREILAGLDGYVGRGGATLYETSTNALRAVQTFPAKDTSTGRVVRILGDLDRDGIGDLTVIGDSFLEMYSGRTKGLLYNIPLGSLVDADHGGDLDGDGKPDWILGYEGNGNGVVVHTTNTYPFRLDANTYPVARRASVDFHVKVGSAHAGKLYLIVCSASGKSPGMQLTPSIHLPLNPDPFMIFGLETLNFQPFVNFAGVLDSGGNGKGTWTWVSVIGPSLVGLGLHFGSVVVDFRRSTIDFATNAAPFVLDK